MVARVAKVSLLISSPPHSWKSQRQQKHRLPIPSEALRIGALRAVRPTTGAPRQPRAHATASRVHTRCSPGRKSSRPSQTVQTAQSGESHRNRKRASRRTCGPDDPGAQRPTLLGARWSRPQNHCSPGRTPSRRSLGDLLIN